MIAAPAPGFEFDEALHRYTLGDLELPSVTQILKSTDVALNFDELLASGRISAKELNEKREVGRAVHVAAQYHDDGNLDRTSLDPRALPYLDGWILFREVTGFQPVFNETRLYHPTRLFAGTLDRAGAFTKYADAQPGDLYIVDLKTGHPEASGARWQTAAYAELLAVSLELTQPGFDAEALRNRPRFAVQLFDDGTYDVKPYRDERLHQDWTRFCNHYNTFQDQYHRRMGRNRV